MAQAPRPGVSTREANQVESQKILTITINRDIFHGDRLVDRTHTFAPNNVPIREQVIVRKAVGLPWSAFWSDEDRIGMDSIAVLWWMARRANGEATLTWPQAADAFPADLSPKDFDVDLDDPSDDDADPEA